MTEQMNPTPAEPSAEAPLEGWKDIATYFNRGVRTVKRWEKEEGLPVRRHQHQARASVYAHPSELEAWKAGRDLPKEEPARMPWQRPRTALAFAATLLLALVSVGSGPILNPPSAAADNGMVSRQLASGDRIPYGSISPDGKFFTDVDWTTGDLVLVDPASLKVLRRLTNKGSWIDSPEYAEFGAVSPDGTQVAYAWFNGKGYDVRLVSVEGGEPRVLYRPPDPAYVAHGSWSPDGRYYAVTVSSADRTNKLLVVNVADGTARVLKSTDWRFPSLGPFSPDGQYLLYDFPPTDDTTERDVYVLAVDGSREVRVTDHPATDRTLGWTADGKKLLFLSDRTGGRGIWTVGFDEGKVQGTPELLRADIGRIHPFGFTQDGSFYYGVNTSFRDAHLARIDFPANHILKSQPVTEKFLGSTSWPGWTPDGKSLVYVSTHGQPWFTQNSLVLVIRNLETGQERELKPNLTQTHPFDVRPTFVPDGSAILLAARDSRRREGIYRVDVRTGEATLLVAADPGSPLKTPALSPDGNTLFYLRHDLRAETATLLARDSARGDERELFSAAVPQWLWSFSVSPDGRQVAAIVDEREARTRAIVAFPVSGGEPRELVRVQEPHFLGTQTGLAWSPVGREVIFRRGKRDSVTTAYWRVPLAGGEPRKFDGEGASPKAAIPGVVGLQVSPDGKWIGFTAGEEKGEVWVLENFLPATRAAK